MRYLVYLPALVFVAVGSGAAALDKEHDCRAVVAGVVAEMKADSAEPLTREALAAARRAAEMACRGQSNVEPTQALAIRDHQQPAADVDTGAEAAGSSAFDFLFTDPVRTRGHKRLKKRGR